MANKTKRGFTLIELLVVISIVGLLSSVVLSSMNSARTKADNTQRNQIADEYRKAFTLAYDANGGYPYAGDTFNHCLGSYGDSLCGNNNAVTYNATINNALINFMGSTVAAFPTMKPVVWGLGTFEGPLYSCSSGSGSICTGNAILRWRLYGTTIQTCIRGAMATLLSDSTLCSLTLQ